MIGKDRKISSPNSWPFSITAPSPPHFPTPLCLSLTTHTLPLPSASPLTTVDVARAYGKGIEAIKNQRTSRTVSDLFWTTHTSPSLDDRHTLLLLRCHSRTAPRAPTARKWKLSMLTIGSEGGTEAGEAMRWKRCWPCIAPSSERSLCTPALPHTDRSSAAPSTALDSRRKGFEDETIGEGSLRRERVAEEVEVGGWWRVGCVFEKEGEKSELDDSPPAHLSACVRCERRRSVSLCVALADDTAPARSLSPHSLPKPSSAALEGRTSLLLGELKERSTSEHCGVQTDRQNIDTADLATCYASPQSLASCATHITSSPSLTARMDGCCQATERTAVDTVVPVESTADEQNQPQTMTVLLRMIEIGGC
ncbi:hypothetical protein BLNAU_8002 [Blattamonas nauphoetae]|uniref:Uncharacterized protein n=1 Tax=Blattamonas nauphoetae TaxID=2049346 RepID=A0ABQ9XZI8_9EUKA|nr:hypothetical protein BLNAU_8002 [Blattamonas nauphoetae]